MDACEQNLNEELQEKLSALYEMLDNCSVIAYEIQEIRRNDRTIKLKYMIDSAQVLVEEEL